MELTNDRIREILPHRYPFLLVDRITDFEPGSWAKGIKCVSANEMHFLGHFPGMSVMPGVLIIEALAQTGAIAILSEPENKGKLVLFGSIKNARFRYQVTPGDVLSLEATLTRKRGAVGVGQGVAKVGDKVACTVEFTYALADPGEKE
ncbi:MAG: 3-hydroxyacyl-ACP dehydratase FabZ [Oscillospiraceae bacterium]|jgi:3-hydroxyacyl-[acyl-carrier-protein] dehydratase|nr:3-hydroxyacyl-ACP dehydratase FabZ [Oscillospiraceae bacterium]